MPAGALFLLVLCLVIGSTVAGKVSLLFAAFRPQYLSQITVSNVPLTISKPLLSYIPGNHSQNSLFTPRSSMEVYCLGVLSMYVSLFLRSVSKSINFPIDDTTYGSQIAR